MASEITQYMLEEFAIDGKEGKVIYTPPGSSTPVELLGVVNITANAEFNTEDFTVVGSRVNQTRTSGVSLSGSCSLYYGTHAWEDMVVQYMQTGRLPRFKLQIDNYDTSSADRDPRRIVLTGVKLSSIPLANLDSDSTFLSSDIDFTFSGIENFQDFSQADLSKSS